MAFKKSDLVLLKDHIWSLINRGRIFVTVDNITGVIVSDHATLEQAKRAKTRRTRVEKTRNLLNLIEK